MSEEKAQNALVESLMSGAVESRERFIIETLLDIKHNGCSKVCTNTIVRPHFIASGVASIVATTIIYLIEYFKK